MNNKQVVDRKLVTLLQSLIKIPSWVSDDGVTNNENQIVDFLENWLKANTHLEILRQELPGGRFNLVARKGNPDMVFLAHTDTVQPSQGGTFDPFEAVMHNHQIHGLGSTDMKSGIASMIQAIKLNPDADNIWLMLYADEEYDFLGMKHLVKEYGNIRPKILISSDGSDLKFGYGCRGCIEFRMRVYGQSGHPARNTGQNAITGSMLALYDLEQMLKSTRHPLMGSTSFNLAYILGGSQIMVSDDGHLSQVGQSGNKVPDVCEFVVDIRPSKPNITLDFVIGCLEDRLRRLSLGFDIIEKTHDIGLWYTDPNRLEKYIQIAREVTGKTEIEFDKPGNTGYIDLHMFWEATGKPDAFMFGGGYGDTAHTPNEHIEIADLIKTRDFFDQVLKSR